MRQSLADAQPHAHTDGVALRLGDGERRLLETRQRPSRIIRRAQFGADRLQRAIQTLQREGKFQIIAERLKPAARVRPLNSATCSTERAINRSSRSKASQSASASTVRPSAAPTARVVSPSARSRANALAQRRLAPIARWRAALAQSARWSRHIGKRVEIAGVGSAAHPVTSRITSDSSVSANLPSSVRSAATLTSSSKRAALTVRRIPPSSSSVTFSR